MQDHIQKQVANAKDLAALQTVLFGLMVETRLRNPRLGYVAGVISADGPEHIARNSQRLIDHTEALRRKHDFPLFSAPDVFSKEVYERIGAHKLTQADFQKFWRDVLEHGYITDIFMAPRWEISNGAKDEHQTAKRLGIPIHYFK